MWAVLALLTALLTSFNPIFYKRMLSAAGPVVVVWSVIGLALPLLALLTFAVNPTLPQVDVLFVWGVCGSALLNALAHLASARSLKLADASLVTPLLTFGPVFTVFISAVLLNELPTLRGLLGVVFVLVGAYWLNRGAKGDWLAPFQSLSTTPGVLLVLCAGLLWSITPIFEKLAIQHTIPTSPRFTALVVNGLLVGLLTPVGLRQGRAAWSALKQQQRAWLAAAFIAGVAPTLGYTAMSLGFVGYVTTLFRLSAVFTVLWGAWLLRESGLRQRLPASLVMVIGAVLITWS
jgi:drug/metabolite transporter (DMT)-like permease